MGWEGLVAGLIVGVAFGAWTARNTICFNAGVRKGAFGGEWTILRIFAVAVGVQLLLLPVLVLLDFGGGDYQVNPGLFTNEDHLPAIGLFPVAQVLGGLLFGFGMALAGGCIAGILWKTGAGSIATAIALLGFAVGELLIRGPLDAIPRELDQASDPVEDAPPIEGLDLLLLPDTRPVTVYGQLGMDFVPVALILGGLLLAAVYFGMRGTKGLVAGLVLGLIGIAAWIGAELSGYGYGLGFVGSAESARNGILDGGTVTMAVWLAVGTVLGAAIFSRGPLRMPDRARALRAGAGGLAMGIGGTIAHGCNIGNGLTGIPLLSVGSILATAMMAAGVWLTWRFLLSGRPALRGHEQPEPSW